MGRFAKGLEYLGKSAVSAGPLDAVFAGFDYADGKAQGEDDIRAGLGAGGAAAGGIGGAMAGAAIGQMAIPIPGVGAAVGAIAGGMMGGFGGGWGADRVDEAVRGNRGAAESERNNERNALTTTAVGAGALGAAGFGISNSKNMNLDDLRYQAKLAGYAGPKQVASTLAGNAGRGAMQHGGQAMRGAGQAIRNAPRPVKMAGAAGAALAGTAMLNGMAGNPIGRAVDSITGQATDFDGSQGRPDYQSDANAMPWQTRDTGLADPRVMQQEVGGREDYVYDRNRRDAIDFANMAHQKRMEFDRDKDQRSHFYGMAKDRQTLDANREISFAGLQSDQAKARLDAFANAGQNASQQLATILNTRFY